LSKAKIKDFALLPILTMAYQLIVAHQQNRTRAILSARTCIPPLLIAFQYERQKKYMGLIHL
jgi:hypothetical protein